MSSVLMIDAAATAAAGVVGMAAMSAAVPAALPKSLYSHSRSLQAASAALFALTTFAMRCPDDASTLVNPWGLSFPVWVALYAAKCASLALLDKIIMALATRFFPHKLKYRTDNPNIKGLPALELIDHIYLTINSAVEYMFALHVFKFAVDCPDVGMFPSEITMLNTVPALWLVFVVDDLFYAPSHRLMHHQSLYAYIHKHHHRQYLPTRGYLDAGNEHPLEQVIGLTCLWAAMHVVVRITGLHLATILVHFTLYAMLALLNHTGQNVEFNWLGFNYTVGAHEMHHRYPGCNMAQYFMFWDRLMGTYRPYVSSSKSASTGKARSE